jgi:NAD-dependent deacetylase
VITQNIDDLHRRAGTRELVEVHGTIAHSSCLRCGSSYPLEEVRARQAADGRDVPRCDCGEPLKPDVVLFGEYLPPRPFERAAQLAEQADLMLCIGTSLEVYPVAELPLRTLAAGGRLAIITHSPTPLDGRAASRLDGDVVDELERLWVELQSKRYSAAGRG